MHESTNHQSWQYNHYTLIVRDYYAAPSGREVNVVSRRHGIFASVGGTNREWNKGTHLQMFTNVTSHLCIKIGELWIKSKRIAIRGM